MSPRPQVDWPSFGAAVAVVALACVPLLAFPEASAEGLGRAYAAITDTLGWTYLLASLGSMVVLAWLVLGFPGRRRLAADDAPPEFSTASWAAMLFSAGIGAGLLAWAPIEWAYYIDAPPFGAEPRSPEAVAWAATFGVFHWGPAAWCFYCLPTIAIAYPYYTKQLSTLRFSTSCHRFLEGREDGRIARVIDWLFIVALLGGAGSSLGFSTPLIAAGLGRLTGVPPGFGLELAVVALCVGMFALSVWFGLARGIRRLSELNVALALGLLLFILVAGPTGFLLETSARSLGRLLTGFVQMARWTDPWVGTEFVERWTVFYWAWWIAYGPFVGLFVTRISRGRTIREVVLGMVGWGTLGGGLFFLVVGHYALHVELEGLVDVTRLLATQGAPTATVAILETLPVPGPAVAAFSLVAVIFAATTYDSAAYTLAASATRGLSVGEDPPRWHRVFWAVALAALPIALMFVGDLTVMQTAVLVASFPILIVGVAMSVALVGDLRHDAR